jgi:hypothetical protein
MAVPCLSTVIYILYKLGALYTISLASLPFSVIVMSLFKSECKNAPRDIKAHNVASFVSIHNRGDEHQFCQYSRQCGVLFAPLAMLSLSICAHLCLHGCISLLLQEHEQDKSLLLLFFAQQLLHHCTEHAHVVHLGELLDYYCFSSFLELHYPHLSQVGDKGHSKCVLLPVFFQYRHCIAQAVIQEEAYAVHYL